MLIFPEDPLWWQIFRNACRVKWWTFLVLVNAVVWLAKLITQAVPGWIVTVDGAVLLAGAVVILTQTSARYRRVTSSRGIPPS